MRIYELRLEADNLVTQRDFYHGMLNMSVLAASPAELTLQVGSTRLTFTHAAHGAQPRAHFDFNVPPQRFAEAKAWLAARTPLIADHHGLDEFAFNNWDARAVYFRDPAGNIVEFIAREGLPPAPPEAFSAASMLCVSEVGMATADVPATARMLAAQLGIAVYRGSASDTFTALGDEHGLFIIVQRGREWYPDTGTPAEFTPIRTVVAPHAGADMLTVEGPPYQVR
jgi:catechol-2,3-dioxygenase